MLNDRYLIYELKNKKVQSNIPDRFGGGKINGLVKDVKRDILESRINLTVDKKIYVLREPNYIIKDGENAILFIYGDVDSQETSDEELLEKMRSMAMKGCHIDDALQTLENDCVIYVKFTILT